MLKPNISKPQHQIRRSPRSFLSPSAVGTACHRWLVGGIQPQAQLGSPRLGTRPPKRILMEPMPTPSCAGCLAAKTKKEEIWRRGWDEGLGTEG